MKIRVIEHNDKLPTITLFASDCYCNNIDCSRTTINVFAATTSPSIFSTAHFTTTLAAIQISGDSDITSFATTSASFEVINHLPTDFPSNNQTLFWLGIAFGIFMFLLLVFLGVWCLVKRRRKLKNNSNQNENDSFKRNSIPIVEPGSNTNFLKINLEGAGDYVNSDSASKQYGGNSYENLFNQHNNDGLQYENCNKQDESFEQKISGDSNYETCVV